MPTTWNRSPEDFHKIYTANTDAFYRLGGISLAKKLDEFMTVCALRLWSFSGSVTQRHVDLANELYSRNQPKPSWMLWGLTSAVCTSDPFLAPAFFSDIVDTDVKKGTTVSRTFIRMFTNIMLYLAAADDDVSIAEAEYITTGIDGLDAICNAYGVSKGQGGLNPLDYITSSEPSFKDKHPASDIQMPKAAGEQTAEADKAAEEEQEKPNFEELMAQLDSLVGLENVKKDVKNLINLVKIRRLRQENDLPVPPMSLHMVFLGNPGTGKTTVARLISGLYASIGVLSKGQLIEVDRSGLVAGYVGQTALKTQEVIKSALGGVLFIDEAYSLASGGDNDFGREAIETILKAMEDHRDDLIVVVAGYTEPMEQFMNSNPGLESRFNKRFFFADYNGEQLLAIFRSQCKKNSYTLTPEAEEAAKAMFDELYENRDANFGNGRDVRNRFEDMIIRQSNRVAQMEAPTKEDLMAILPEDLHDEEESIESSDTAESAEKTED